MGGDVVGNGGGRVCARGPGFQDRFADRRRGPIAGSCLPSVEVTIDRGKLNRRAEGVFILVTLRPIGVLAMFGFLAYLINPEWMAWSAVQLPAWLRWVGVALGAVAGALVIYTFRTLGGNLTDTVVTRARHTLITDGPYRWVRHPFYVACAVMVAASALMTANWFIGLAGGIAILLLALRSGTEERKLEERFGDEYRSYRRQTGRFFPRLGRRGE